VRSFLNKLHELMLLAFSLCYFKIPSLALTHHHHTPFLSPPLFSCLNYHFEGSRDKEKESFTFFFMLTRLLHSSLIVYNCLTAQRKRVSEKFSLFRDSATLISSHRIFNYMEMRERASEQKHMNKLLAVYIERGEAKKLKFSL
jgi:hypothetical protein